MSQGAASVGIERDDCAVGEAGAFAERGWSCGKGS